MTCTGSVLVQSQLINSIFHRSNLIGSVIGVNNFIYDCMTFYRTVYQRGVKAAEAICLSRGKEGILVKVP